MPPRRRLPLLFGRREAPATYGALFPAEMCGKQYLRVFPMSWVTFWVTIALISASPRAANVGHDNWDGPAGGQWTPTELHSH